MDIQFNSKAFATFSKSSRCMKVSISVLWRIRATSSNVSISLLIDTDAKYRLIDCVWERGAKKVCAYIQYFFSVCYYIHNLVIVWMITIINIEKSLFKASSFHEYIMIMNIGQSILITERVSFFPSLLIFLRNTNIYTYVTDTNCSTVSVANPSNLNSLFQ